MIFKLKTSQKTQQIFAEIGKSTSLKPYTLVKHAIAWSLKEQGKITSFSSDNEGLELNRQTITGEYDDYFKVLIEQAEGRHLSNEEYFSQIYQSPYRFVGRFFWNPTISTLATWINMCWKPLGLVIPYDLF